MTLEQKVDELTSLIKAMDLKIKFLLDDTEELKVRLAEVNDTVFQLAMNSQQSQSNESKADRLAKFREQTARW